MSTYSVQFSSMQSAMDGLNSVYQRLTQIGEDLNTQIKAGTAEFHGSTADAFAQAQAQYNQAHEEFSQSLQQANQALSGIHDEYNSAETRGTALWAR